MDTKLVDSFIIDILKHNGWYEGRLNKEKYYYDKLIADGFVLNEYVENIMNEFGGIKVNCIIDSKENLGYHGATFEFDIYYGWNQDFLLKPFEEKIGSTIFPIGRMYDAVVYVSDNNKIYIGDCEDLICVGIGIESYLNYLFVDDYDYEIIDISDLLFE